MRRIGFRQRKEQLEEQQQDAHQKLENICLQFSQDILDLLLGLDDKSKAIFMSRIEKSIAEILSPKKE